MPGLPSLLPILLAQAPAGGGDSSNIFWIYIIPVFAVFYFLIILPQQRQEKKRRAMIDALKKNDRVITSGGIYGTVVSVDGAQDRVVLRVDDERGIRMNFARSSVVRVLESGNEKGTDAA
jgi:preprotein translocase subunit YajC